MTFAARDLKDVANRVARKLEDYMNNERRETRFAPAGCFRTTKKMQNYDLLTRVMETSDLDCVPTANMKRKKSPGRKSPRNISPDGKMKNMPKSRKKDASKERASVKKHKSSKTEEKRDSACDTDKRGVETKKDKETKIVKKETWMRLIDADVDKPSDHKLKIAPKLEKTSRTIVAKKEAARLSEYASYVFEEQPLDKLHVIHRYRPNSMDVPHVTENGKVQNYTCHFGSALHAKKYVDYYMKEGLQTGKKEYSKRLQQLRTRDTSSDKGSEKSVRTVGSASTMKSKEYSTSHSEKSRGMLPPIHTSSSDLVSPRSNHSAQSSDSVMSGFSRYTSSSFSSGLPSTYKIVAKRHCPPSNTVQMGQPMIHSYSEPHPPLTESMDLDYRCPTRKRVGRKVPASREAFADQTDGKIPLIQSLMLDRASSTTDLLPMQDTFTQTPRNDERELSIMDSVVSASDIYINQETQTPRSSIHSARKKKKKTKKRHSKDRLDLMIDVHDEGVPLSETRHDVRTGRRHNRHMGTSSVSDLDVSSMDNDNNTYDGNTSYDTTFLKKPERIAKLCQTSFSTVSENCYTDPLSESPYPYSPKTINIADMNESLLLQSVEGDNDVSSLPNSTVHLYKSSQDQEPSDSLFESEEQNARYADLGVLEENRADIGISEEYYSYDRAGEKVDEKHGNRKHEDLNTLTNESVEKVNGMHDCHQNESTPYQSDDECFWESRGEKAASFESKDQTTDVDLERLEDINAKNELLSPVGRTTESRTSSPREDTVILFVTETPRKNETFEPSADQDFGKNETLEPSQEEDIVKNEDSVVNDLLSESVEEVHRGTVEMAAYDEDPRGDPLLSGVDETQETYLGNFNKSFQLKDPVQKLSSDYKYVPEERGSDGESFVDSEPEAEVYTKADDSLEKDADDDKRETDVEICRGSVPPKRKESNASSYCSVTRAAVDTFPVYHEEQFHRPGSCCSQVTSTRGSGKSLSLKSERDHESRPQSAQDGNSKHILDETQNLLDEEEMIEMTKSADVLVGLPVLAASNDKVEVSQVPDRSSSQCCRGSGDNLLTDLDTSIRGQDGYVNNDTLEKDLQAEEHNGDMEILNLTGQRGIQTEVVSQLINEDTFAMEHAIKKETNGHKIVEEGFGEAKDSASTSENEHTSDTSSCRGTGGNKSDSVVSSRGLDGDISFEHLNVKQGSEENSDYGSMVLRIDDASSKPGMENIPVQEANKQNFADMDEITPESMREDIFDTKSVDVPAHEENDKLNDDMLQELQEKEGTLEITNMDRLDVSEIPNDSLCVIGGRGMENDLSQMSVDVGTESCMIECDNEEMQESILKVQMNSTVYSGAEGPSSAHIPQMSVQMARPKSAHPLATSLITKPVFEEFTANVKADEESAKSEEILHDTYDEPKPNRDYSHLNESRGKIENYTGLVPQKRDIDKQVDKQREECICEESGQVNEVPETSSGDVPNHFRHDGVNTDVESKEEFKPEEGIPRDVELDSVSKTVITVASQETADNNRDQTTKVEELHETKRLKADTELNVESSWVETSQELEPLRIDFEVTPSELSTERGVATSPRLAPVPVVRKLDRSPSVCSRGSVSEDNDSPPDIQVSKICHQSSETQDDIETVHYESECKKTEDAVKHMEDHLLEGPNTMQSAEDNVEVITAVDEALELDQKEGTDKVITKIQHSATRRGSITHRDAVLGTNVLVDVLSTCGSDIIERSEQEKYSEERDLKAASRRQQESTPHRDQETNNELKGKIPGQENLMIEQEGALLEKSANPTNCDGDLKEIPPGQEIKTNSDNPTKTEEEDSSYPPGKLQEELLNDFTPKGQHFDDDLKDIPTGQETEINSLFQKNEQGQSHALESVKAVSGVLQEESVNEFTVEAQHCDCDLEKTPVSKAKYKELGTHVDKIPEHVMLQQESANFFMKEDQHSDSDISNLPPSQEVQMDVADPRMTEIETQETIENTHNVLQKECVNFFDTNGDTGQTLSSSVLTEEQTVLQSTILSEDTTLLPSTLDTIDDSTDSSTSSGSSETETTSNPESVQYLRTEDMSSATRLQMQHDHALELSKEQYTINQTKEATAISTEYEHDKEEQTSLNCLKTITQETKVYDEISEAEICHCVGSSPASGACKDTSIMSSTAENRGAQDQQLQIEASRQSARGNETLSTVEQSMLLLECSPLSETYINGSPLVPAEGILSENNEDEKLSYCNLTIPLSSYRVEQTKIPHEQITVDDDYSKDKQIIEKSTTEDFLSPSNMVSDNTGTTDFVMSADVTSFAPTPEINTDRNEYHLVLNNESESSDDPKGLVSKNLSEEKDSAFVYIKENSHMEDFQNKQTESFEEPEKIQERKSDREQELVLKPIQMHSYPMTVLDVGVIAEEAAFAAKTTLPEQSSILKVKSETNSDTIPMPAEAISSTYLTLNDESSIVKTKTEKTPDSIPAELITPTQLETNEESSIVKTKTEKTPDSIPAELITPTQLETNEESSIVKTKTEKTPDSIPAELITPTQLESNDESSIVKTKTEKTPDSIPAELITPTQLETNDESSIVKTKTEKTPDSIPAELITPTQLETNEESSIVKTKTEKTPDSIPAELITPTQLESNEESSIVKTKTEKTPDSIPAELITPTQLETNEESSIVKTKSEKTPDSIPAELITPTQLETNDESSIVKTKSEKTPDSIPAELITPTQLESNDESSIVKTKTEKTPDSIPSELITPTQLEIYVESSIVKTKSERTPDSIPAELITPTQLESNDESSIVKTKGEKTPDSIPAELITPTQLETNVEHKPYLASEQRSMMHETHIILEDALDNQNMETSQSSLNLTDENAKAISRGKAILVSEKTDFQSVNVCLVTESKTESPVSKSSKCYLVSESEGDAFAVARPVIPTESSNVRSIGSEYSQQGSDKAEQTDLMSENVSNTSPSLKTKDVELGGTVVNDSMTESETVLDVSDTVNPHNLNTDDTEKVVNNPESDAAAMVESSSGRQMSKSGISSDACLQSDNQTPGHRIILVSENIPSAIPEAKVIERSPGAPRVILVSEKSQN